MKLEGVFVDARSSSENLFSLSVREACALNRIIILVFLLAIGGCKKESGHTLEIPPKPTPQKQIVTREKVSELAIPESIPKENDIELRNRFRQDIQQLFADKEFEKLEQMESELTISKAKFPGGDWKIGRFLEAFGASEDFTTEEEWETYFAVLEDWKARRPDSGLAKLLIADALVGYGWMARGDGFASEVTGEGFMLFSERLNQAQKMLQELNNDRKKHFNYYNVQDRIARGLGWRLEKYDEFFYEAVEMEPLYWEFYQNKAIVLMPQWQGENGEWQAFAEESANKIGGDQGDILYAEICWQIFRFLTSKEFYDGNRVQWSRIRRGFILLEKHYGVSYRYLNAFALMSAGSKDYAASKILFQRIGDNWEPDFYSSKKRFDKYKDWAAQLP